MPETSSIGEPLRVRFWWSVQGNVAGDYTQFLHLIPENGGEMTGYDQPPFGGSFPTYDWRAGALIVDEWTIPLPADMQPGIYRVYSGMYTLATLERLPVTDDEGQPQPDNAIALGAIALQR